MEMEDAPIMTADEFAEYVLSHPFLPWFLLNMAEQQEVAQCSNRS